jgi:serine/threonine protein kinase/tetratricopeptide (TPR) repeat protein
MSEGEAYGRYRLLGRIGRGASGEVFKAKSFGVEGFEKTLVVKRLLPELARDTRFVEEFVAHTRLAVRLSHSNVAQVFDLGRVDAPGGASYFTAGEYVAGLDLRRLLARMRELSEPVAVELVLFLGAELCKALDHAHRRQDESMRPLGVVHGDVGPSNVLLSWDGEVKLADFCVALPLYELARRDPEQLGRIADKLGRASPELCAGKPVDARSDLFSLGALLYELLAGRPPFSGDGAVATRARVLEGRYEPLDRARPDVAAEVVDLVHRALAADPAKRTESAARMHEELLALSYTVAGRFGASELGDLLERCQEAPAAPVPEATLESALGHASGLFRIPTVESVAPPPPGPATALEKLAELGSARDVSGLVLSFSGQAAPALFERAREIVTRYGGREAEAGSSEVAALFGVMPVDSRDTENAVRCGLVLLRALGPLAELSVGVETGRLKDAGPDESRNALLDASRRLAALASRRVVISPSAAHNVRGAFGLEPIDKTGKDGWLVGEARPTAVAGSFVGRAAELRKMAELLSLASRKKLQVVGITGPHGVGKTRLLSETERRLGRGTFNIGVYMAVCPPRGRELPASGIASMLRTLCGVRDGDPPELIVAVEPRLRALGLRDDEVSAVLSLLGVARGGADTAAALKSAVIRAFASLAEDRLHVFVWDDAHEMDSESAELVRTAAERLAHSRIVLALCGRSLQEQGTSELSSYTEITVSDLSSEEVESLIADRLSVSEVPKALTDFVRERAGGHPMFVEELLHEAHESDAVAVRGGRVVNLELGGAIAVPRPLRALLGDRVRRLPESERGLLVAAAVLGAPVDLAVLATMLDLPLGTVNALADSLAERQLLVRQGPVEVGFASPLLSEVMLSELTPDVRMELHQQAANAYQIALGPRTEEQSALIGHHLAEAGETDRAAGFFATSGLFQLEARRLDIAAVHLARALDLADLANRDGTQLSEWVAALSSAVRHVRSGANLPPLIQRLSGWLVLARRVDARLRGQMTIDLALALAALHRYKEARRLLQRAADSASHWPELSRAALTAEAEIATRQGEFKLAVQALNRVWELGPGDASDEHRILVATAQAEAGAGQFDEALQALDRAQSLAGADDPVLSGERAKVRALISGFQGDWASCARASEQAAEQMRERGLMHEVAVNLHNQGDALIRVGDRPRAYAALQASLAAAEEINSERMVNLDTMMLAYLDAVKGSEDARQVLGQRIARAEMQRWTWDVVTGRYLLGKLYAERGDAVAARRELGLARSMAVSSDNRPLVTDCDTELKKLGPA